MREPILHMSVTGKNLLTDTIEKAHRSMSGPDSERGEGVVGYLLALLLVIAGVAVVRPIILNMLGDEASNIDLDLSGGDSAPADG